MFKHLLPLLLIVALLSSCSSDPVKVVIDKKDLSSGKIKIDNKEEYTFKDSVINIKLLPGKHSFVLDKKPAVEFTVGDKGGLLNIDNQEYVAFEIEYTDEKSGDGFNLSRMRSNAVILIDSFVLTPKRNVTMPGRDPFDVKPSDTSLLLILPQLQASKNGNYFASQSESNYDTDNTIHGLKKFGKDKIFIDAFWDYSLGEEIPESITWTTRENDFVASNSSKIKVAVLQAPLFLLVAQMSPEEYSVKSIAQIQSREEDKANEAIKSAKEAKKEKSQMAF